jgi:hypothetical protein
MPGRKTPTIDLSKSRFQNVKELTGQRKTENRYRIINGILNGQSMASVGPDSETGPIPTGIAPEEDSAD